MGEGHRGVGARYFRMLFTVGTVGGLTDAQLLERFQAAEEGGEAAELAFSTLVERHGPMVLRVCRSVLRDPDAAHDAFQATFLVLVRRAGSLWVRDSLAPWLHQVAYRVASNARSASARRRRHERRAAELSGPAVAQDEGREPLGMEDALHDEVNRLPGGCRSAVVLCYFEGLSPEQAARQLGCPLGTVQSRLARGREKLRSRLTRRGLAPALGALGMGVASEAAPSVLPASLAEATVRAALATSAVSGSVVQLTQGVLTSMFLIKARIVAASIFTIAALAAGAGAMLQDGPAPRPKPVEKSERPPADAPGNAAPRQLADEAGPPPADLKWADVPPDERQRILEQLAAATKDNYEKIKKWRGTYAYIIRQHLNEQFTADLLAGVQPTGKAAPPAKPEPLMQEFDRVLKFAIDIDSDSIFRDVETRRMRFLKIGTDEEVKIPNVGASDHRWIVTPARFVDFNPKNRATSSFLPDHPEGQNKRSAERYPASEARNRAGGEIDPREFFKFDPGNTFWRGFEIYQRAFRGELGAEAKKIFEERLKFEQAEGPGGRWYRERMGFGNPGQPMFWRTTLWSPQAGYNPVSRVTAIDKPDGKLQGEMRWRWKRFDRAYLPSRVEERVYGAPGGGLSKDQVATLKECVLNRPFGLRQFDEQALGLADGDLILDHPEKVVYIIKGGKPTKLANFGEGSILKPAPPKLAMKSATATKPSPKSAGRIYTTASLGTDNRGMPVSSVVAVDPETGEVTKVFDGSPHRFRISPDGKRAAFTSVEWWSNLPPAERSTDCLWTQALNPTSRPERVIRLNTPGGGGMPIWSADGKRMIVSEGTYDDARKRSTFETFRVNADGSGRETLKLPTEDTVQDWSADGEWLLVASTRNAKIGWQLYIMRLDGTDMRQITEGGNPHHARFSPDGKRLVYTDGPWKIKEKRGVWVMDFDGKNRRRVLEVVKESASACWSPDGKRLAVAIGGAEPKDKGRLEIVDIESGARRTLLTMPGREIADMPDWR